MPYNYELCFKTPQKRWIFVPTLQCRSKGKEFINIISEHWTVPNCFYHFKSGGHVAAVKLHAGHSFFAKLDIQKFFPSITKNKILRALKAINISYAKARTIAEWSVVTCKEDQTKRSLPYGFVQSQFIAALCMDKSALGKFIKNGMLRNIAISVYVDDIILSSNNEADLLIAYEGMMAAITEAGFSINEKKSHAPQLNSIAFNIDFDSTSAEITQERFQEFIKAMSLVNYKKSEAIVGYVNTVSSNQAEVLVERLKFLSENNSI